MNTSLDLLSAAGAFLALGGLGAAQDGPSMALVNDMLREVSQARLTESVRALQDFETRYTFSPGNTDAGDWLYDAFRSLGLEVERHAFTWGTQSEENVVARIRGVSRPGELVLVSGHFDSTSETPGVLAPGADDDASAIAGVLEAARILKDYHFQRTVEFVCYNAEEQGRRGSIAIARDYQAAGRDIVAVVNSDMIGYWPSGWERDLDVAYEPVSEWLADHVLSVVHRYVGIPAAKHLSGMCRDDHVSFTARGIPAVSTMDCWDAHNGGSETTPHYHRTTDTLDTLNLECMTQVVQVNLAAVAELAGPIGRAFMPYCTATPNSTGEAARITARGSARISLNDLTLVAQPVPDEPFVFFLGPNQVELPFGDGLLCVGGGLTRLLPPRVASDYVATRVLDLPSLGITLRVSHNFQCWFRDPAAGGAMFNTSDGLSIAFLP